MSPWLRTLLFVVPAVVGAAIAVLAVRQDAPLFIFLGVLITLSGCLGLLQHRQRRR